MPSYGRKPPYAVNCLCMRQPQPERTKRNTRCKEEQNETRCSSEYLEQAKIARSTNYNCSIWRGCRLRRIAGRRAHCFKPVRPNAGNHTIALITSFEGNGRIFCVWLWLWASHLNKINILCTLCGYVHARSERFIVLTSYYKHFIR